MYIYHRQRKGSRDLFRSGEHSAIDSIKISQVKPSGLPVFLFILGCIVREGYREGNDQIDVTPSVVRRNGIN